MAAVDWAEARAQMVADQLERRGVRDPHVLEAMRRVPRHLFVPPEQRVSAYEDRALPIGNGQTISQPYMVAIMSEALGPVAGKRVLEIGTGSGYQAAILGQLAGEVITIERRAELAEAARQTLTTLGYTNITVLVADGSSGHAPAAPYAGIVVAAGAPHAPGSLKAQLTEGGKLVVPIGSPFHQDLVVIERHGDAFIERRGEGCVFVPLVGREGWPEG